MHSIPPLALDAGECSASRVDAQLGVKTVPAITTIRRTYIF
jgi:hypothetical protein